MSLPPDGTSREQIIARMRAMKSGDADWRSGRTWSLIYPAGEDVDAVLRDAANLYLFENALNPLRFPSLWRMEQEVVGMTASLVSAGEDAGGAMMSGGTESILQAVKSARNHGREERGITRPEMVVPASAHPAFAKAASYLGLELKTAPLRDDFRADVSAVESLLSDNTVLIAGSAPGYPHGVVDPIPELAALADARGIWFHTDACLGGFLLPFLERMHEPVPAFDFRVPGVRSLSADVHKYGYATKGASVVLYRANTDLMRYQLFWYEAWPGGRYGSLGMAGARPAAPIAVAWAVMNYLGEAGYLRLAARVRDATKRIRDGIGEIAGLEILGNPDMSVLAFGSDRLDVAAVGDRMDDRGWHLDRQTDPDALHLMVSPEHDAVVEEFLSDLAAAAADPGSSRGAEARYA